MFEYKIIKKLRGWVGVVRVTVATSDCGELQVVAGCHRESWRMQANRQGLVPYAVYHIDLTVGHCRIHEILM